MFMQASSKQKETKDGINWSNHSHSGKHYTHQKHAVEELVGGIECMEKAFPLRDANKKIMSCMQRRSILIVGKCLLLSHSTGGHEAIIIVVLIKHGKNITNDIENSHLF